MLRKIAAPQAVAAALAMMLPASAIAQSAEAPAQEAEAVPSAPPAAAIIANLDKISPLQIVHPVSEYWQRGDKLQAALWFYIWQIRTDAWVGTDPAFDNARSALNSQMGQTINGWIAADPDLWLATARRAIAFESKLPLWTTRPPEMTEEEWNTRIATTRAEYKTGMEEAFAETGPDAIRAGRRENGLYVGTLTDAGAPLPDEWH